MAQKRKPLMRSLGEFFGHIAHGIRTDPAKGRVVKRERVEEEVRETPSGPVVVRRTVIEEVELPPPTRTPPGA